MKKLKLFLAFIFVILLQVNIGCNSTPRAEKTEDIKIAPEFTLNDITYKRVSLSQYKGKKYVLLAFWTTWCPYCVSEIPKLKRLYEKYKNKDLAILSINIRESPKKVASFVEKYSMPYTVLLDTAGKVANAYGVRGIPYHVVIDKNGTILYEGIISFSELEVLISKLLKN